MKLCCILVHEAMGCSAASNVDGEQRRLAPTVQAQLADKNCVLALRHSVIYELAAAL